ncbi:MAG: prepilin-type N-terminal cleavage/methylation domain-containing protein [Phycisphaerales bacterium]|nr:prepilin-type N-terminal cleavage/methylation domain-containing protein [Phycisphaerales bacterium]
MTRGAGTPNVPRCGRRGITLVEAMICIVLVGVVLAASIHTVGAAKMTESRLADRATAEALAEELLAEILTRLYREPDASTGLLGADSGELSRSQFDDVDDYHGFGETPPTDALLAPIVSLTGWRRSVTVGWVVPDAALAPSASETLAKLIRVQVQDSRGALLMERVAVVTDNALNRPGRDLTTVRITGAEEVVVGSGTGSGSSTFWDTFLSLLGGGH